MQQIFLPTEEKQNTPKTCVFTGHRELGDDFSLRKLKKSIKTLIESGVDTFLNGMAMGFDLVSAEMLLVVKKKYPFIKLVACMPCYHQEKYFTEKDKNRYAEILRQADEKIYVSEEYFNGCMQKRDKYMAERADVMIAYLKKPTGGTAFTVRTFKRIKPFAEILYL